MSTKRVIAAGHICLDMTPLFPSNGYKDAIGDLFVPGKLIRMQGCDVNTGGSVANTGLAMKKMGLDVRLMGKAGRDEFGDMLESILASHGVSGLIRDTSSPTSYSVVLAVPGIDRIFLHDPGANDTFESADIRDEELNNTDLLHFGYPPLMKNMSVRDGEELKMLFIRAHQAGAATSLDMAAIDPESDEAKVNWERYLANVLPVTDFFVPSFEELCFMLDRNKYSMMSSSKMAMTEQAELERDVKPLAEKVLSMGAGCVLIKCGTKGMLLMSSDQKKLEAIPGRPCDPVKWAGLCITQECLKAPCVLSATGAGDTAAAAFLYGVLNGCTPSKSLKLAAAQGAMCVTRYDAVSGLKTATELEKIFDIREE